MNKLLKQVLALALALMLLLSFSACGAPAESTPADSSAESTSQAEPMEDKEEQTVVVWSANAHDADYVNAKVAEFNEANKGDIQIDYQINPDDYINVITMAASSGQMPDVINIASITNGFVLQNFVDANIIQPLNTYMTDDFKTMVDLENVMYEAMNSIGDDVYYVPTGLRSGSRIIYNTELFANAGYGEEMPKNAEELIDAAKKITEAGGGVQYGYVVPGLSAPVMRLMDPMAKVSGITEYDFVNGKYDFTGFKPIIEVIRTMFADGSILPGATSMKIDPSRVQFAEGNVGFYASMSQEVGVLTDQFPAKIEWSAAEIPSLDGEIKGALAAAPNMGWLLSASTDKADAAWRVIEYFSSDEFVKGYIEAGLNLPITQRMSELVDQEKMGKLADFSLLSYESVYPTVPVVTPEGEPWKDAIWNACVDPSIDVDQLLADLTDAYNTALDADVEMGKVKRLVIQDYDPMKPSAGTFEYLSE